MTIVSTLEGIASDFLKALSPASPPAAPPASVPAPTAKLTGAQIDSALGAVMPMLAWLQKQMASPTFQTAVVVSEDIESVLSNFIPGVAAVEQGEEIAVALAPEAIAAAQAAWPVLSPLVALWLDSGAFSAAPGGIPGDDLPGVPSSSRGR